MVASSGASFLSPMHKSTPMRRWGQPCRREIQVFNSTTTASSGLSSRLSNLCFEGPLQRKSPALCRPTSVLPVGQGLAHILVREVHHHVVEECSCIGALLRGPSRKRITRTWLFSNSSLQSGIHPQRVESGAHHLAGVGRLLDPDVDRAPRRCPAPSCCPEFPRCASRSPGSI